MFKLGCSNESVNKSKQTILRSYHCQICYHLQCHVASQGNLRLSEHDSKEKHVVILFSVLGQWLG